MSHSKEYFSLQLTFAERVAEILNIKLSDALLGYTTCYKKFNIPCWDFDPLQPVWQDFARRLDVSQDKLTAIYDFYLSRLDTDEDAPHFGCFAYEYAADKRQIQIHFKNRDMSGLGPLSSQRFEARLSDLKEMFTEIKTNYPEARTVKGFSWLYNLPAYNRLFPASYTHAPKVVQGWFKSYAIWGQFVNYKREVKKDLAEKFLSCAATKSSIEELENCFPYRLLEPEGVITDFYDFYHI